MEVGPALVSLLILPVLPETPRYLLLVTQNREAARKGHSTRSRYVVITSLPLNLCQLSLNACLRCLGSVVVRASDSGDGIGRSRVRLPVGALPGSLGQLSLPSLRGR